MKYMGSKSKISKDIIPIIQELINKNNIKQYIEPFVGGANIIDKITCEKRIGSDKNKYLIELLKNAHKVEDFPDEISREHYGEVRTCFNQKLNTYEDWYIGAIGFLASYNGRFFDGGYAQTNYDKRPSGHVVVRNYYKEAKENLLEQLPRLNDIQFRHSEYSEYIAVKNALIYCDPPYKDTKQYGTSSKFNHDVFWQWVRDMSKDNIVLVSECQAPDDFKCLWQQEVTRTIDNNKRVKSIEKLYTYNI